MPDVTNFCCLFFVFPHIHDVAALWSHSPALSFCLLIQPPTLSSSHSPHTFSDQPLTNPHTHPNAHPHTHPNAHQHTHPNAHPNAHQPLTQPPAHSSIHSTNLKNSQRKSGRNKKSPKENPLWVCVYFSWQCGHRAAFLPNMRLSLMEHTIVLVLDLQLLTQLCDGFINGLGGFYLYFIATKDILKSLIMNTSEAGQPILEINMIWRQLRLSARLTIIQLNVDISIDSTQSRHRCVRRNVDMRESKVVFQ